MVIVDMENGTMSANIAALGTAIKFFFGCKVRCLTGVVCSIVLATAIK